MRNVLPGRIHEGINIPVLLPIILGCIHFLSDLSAGLLIGRAAKEFSGADLSVMILIYNFIAFALQPIAGIIADRYNLSQHFVYGGLITGPLSLFLFPLSPWVAVIIAGIGSSIFHVGGGALSISADENKAAYIGIFLSPGVIGLALGGFLAYADLFPVYLLSALFIVLLIIFSFTPKMVLQTARPASFFIPDKHDLVMIIILMAIAFRSAVWNVFQYISLGDFSLLIPIAISAGMGKITGGMMADFFGKRFWLYISLTMSIVFLSVTEYSRFFLYTGIFFLQSSTPVAVRILADAYKKIPATVAGLSFGLAIALGAVPHYFHFHSVMTHSLFVMYSFIVISCLLLIYSIKIVYTRIKPS